MGEPGHIWTERLGGGPFLHLDHETQASKSGQLLVSNKQISPTLFLSLADFCFRGILPRACSLELQSSSPTLASPGLGLWL